MYKYLFVIWLAAMFLGCYEPQEGCLDIKATNFDATADEPCPLCCEYPKLVLQCVHYVDTNKLSVSGLWKDAADVPFAVNLVRFFVSDVTLVRADNSEVTVSDSMKYALEGDTFYLPKRFDLMNTQQFTFTIGTFPAEGVYTKIKFKVGIELPEGVQPAGFPTSIPSLATLGMFDVNLFAYYNNVLTIDRDTSSLEDLKSYVLATSDYMANVELTFPQPLDAKEGFNTTVKLHLDHSKWFTGVSINSDSEAEIVEKILTNTPSVFLLEWGH